MKKIYLVFICVICLCSFLPFSCLALGTNSSSYEEFSDEQSEVDYINPSNLVSSFGYIDFSFESDHFELKDTDVTLKFYFYSQYKAHIAEDIESYNVYMNGKPIASFDDGVYGKEHFIAHIENGQTVYPAEHTVTISKEIFSEDFGAVSFYIEGKKINNFVTDDNIAVSQNEELAPPRWLYYKNSAGFVELSERPFRIKSALFIDEAEQGQSDTELDVWKNQISELSEKYFVSCKEMTFYSGKAEGFAVKNHSDDSLRCNVAVGSRDAIGRVKIEYCTINEKRENARFIYALTLNYKGDYSFEFSDSVGIDVMYVYLWDDGVVLQIGTGASNVMEAKISDAAVILNTDVNSEIRSEIETNYAEGKSVGKWNLDIEKSDILLVNSEKRRVIATAEDGAKYIVYDEIPRVIEVIMEFFVYIFGIFR